MPLNIIFFNCNTCKVKEVEADHANSVRIASSGRKARAISCTITTKAIKVVKVANTNPTMGEEAEAVILTLNLIMAEEAEVIIILNLTMEAEAAAFIIPSSQVVE